MAKNLVRVKVFPMLSKTFSTMLLTMTLSICLISCAQQEDNYTNSSESKQEKQNQNQNTAVVPTVKVHSANLERTVRIPAELSAFREVAIHPKVHGFIKHVYVDRGSTVKQGQILIEIVAPELEANYQESRAKLETVSSALVQAQSNVANFTAQKDEAEAKVEAEEANYKRIQYAAQTAGAIAPVDLEAAEKTLQGSRAHVRAAEQAVIGAQAELESQKGRIRSAKQALISMAEMRAYLTVRAPFNGTITERNVHEGSLVSSSASSTALLKIQETSKLRLIVPVPEEDIAGIKQGAEMKFTVPAFLGKTFTGYIARISHGLDRKTRTMVIELDVSNPRQELEPGMYAEVVWEMRRPYQTLFVPASAIVSKEDKTYVIRVRNSVAEMLPVSRGQAMGQQVEVVGNLVSGDEVVLDARDDIKPGAKINSKLEATKASKHNEHDE